MALASIRFGNTGGDRPPFQTSLARVKKQDFPATKNNARDFSCLRTENPTCNQNFRWYIR